jgi:hypothetical protein
MNQSSYLRDLSSTEEHNKYVCDSNNTVKEKLSQYGVAIIPSLLDENECENLVTGMWNYLEHISANWTLPISRKDNSTWAQMIDNLFLIKGFLNKYWKCGHYQSVWDVRQNPKVVSVFAQLLNCECGDLLASFDGVSFGAPPEITNRGWQKKSVLPIHTDGKPEETDLFQSWVTGLDVEEGDATLAFLEGSNNYYDLINKKYDIVDGSDWYTRLNKQIFEELCAMCPLKRITCPRGSLVIWSSKTLHCGVQPLKSRPHPHFRCVVYLCYGLKSKCSKKDLVKKKKAFTELRMTMHNPVKVYLNSKTPRT